MDADISIVSIPAVRRRVNNYLDTLLTSMVIVATLALMVRNDIHLPKLHYSNLPCPS